MDWSPLPKPAETAENRLVSAILNGHFPVGSFLPPERDLATKLGVTRPTLREALQRLARDGWIEIHHGRPTRVRDFWVEGNLGVLGAVANHPAELPSSFITDLLSVRLVLAPEYSRQAILKDAARIATFLSSFLALEDDPHAFTLADWNLHHLLTVASGNPIYTLILNGFYSLYRTVGPAYFSDQGARRLSRAFYSDLQAIAKKPDPEEAYRIVQRVMRESIQQWEARS